MSIWTLGGTAKYCIIAALSRMTMMMKFYFMQGVAESSLLSHVCPVVPNSQFPYTLSIHLLIKELKKPA